MQQYSLIIDDISSLLNKKGRNKKGFNAQEHFLSVLTELKQNYDKELSTKFLFNLMTADNTTKQKRQKIRNLLKGCRIKKRVFYTRGLEVLNYRTDIKTYSFNKWGECRLKKIIIEHISKEFITTKRENLKFIKI